MAFDSTRAPRAVDPLISLVPIRQRVRVPPDAQMPAASAPEHQSCWVDAGAHETPADGVGDLRAEAARGRQTFEIVLGLNEERRDLRMGELRIATDTFHFGALMGGIAIRAACAPELHDGQPWYELEVLAREGRAPEEIGSRYRTTPAPPCAAPSRA